MEPVPTDAESLGVAYRAVAGACGVQIQLGDPAERAVRPVDLDRAIDHQSTMLERRYGPVRRPVAALWALHRHLLVTALMLTGPYLIHRRIPRIAPGGIALDPAGITARVAAGDGAGAPATAAHLRSALVGHCAPLLAAYRSPTRAGERSLWGAATDQIAGGLWHLGRTLDREQEATSIATLLLPGDTPPFVGAAAFRPAAPVDGVASQPPRAPGSAMTRTRVRCCLLYTASPDDTCATCPRRRSD